MSRIRKAWEEEMESIEEEFLNGEVSEEYTKIRLMKICPGMYDIMWSILYDMRKHGIKYGD